MLSACNVKYVKSILNLQSENTTNVFPCKIKDTVQLTLVFCEDTTAEYIVHYLFRLLHQLATLILSYHIHWCGRGIRTVPLEERAIPNIPKFSCQRRREPGP